MRHVPVAIAFGRLHQQGMKLIEQGFVRRQMLVQESLRGMVISRGREKMVARKNAARVSIRNKYRVPPRIKQNRVGGFRTNPFQCQKLRAGARCVLSEKRVERTSMRPLDPMGKIVKGPGLLPVKTRRANERCKFVQGDLTKAPAARGGLPGGDSSMPKLHSARWYFGSGWRPKSLPSGFAPATIPGARSSPEVSRRSAEELHPAPTRRAQLLTAYFQKLYSAPFKVKVSPAILRG